MNVKRYVAPNARDALSRIRQELGPDAVVVTSREVPGGVEFMAARYTDLAKDAPTQTPQRELNEQATAGLMVELKGIKQLIKGQLANLSWSVDKRRHPMRVEMVQTLLIAGFSPWLARSLAARMPRGMDVQGMNRWLRAVLIRNLPAWNKPDSIWMRGGTWALVGPTGAGKTTTLAKLATRAADVLGANQVALVTMDAYRIGAYDQARTYADLLNVELIKVNAAENLAAALATVRHKKVVLLDTPGLSPRDERIVHLLEVLSSVGAHRLLVMPSGVQGPVVEATLAAYGGHGLAACILSKLDEGGLLGPALDGLIRHRLPVACLASGQRVPEDLYPAQPQALIDRALRARQLDVYRMHEEDWPLIEVAAESANRHG
ncbi:MAG: flagellar biosynthesis protein FlhF [Thiobacillaceae bacterium]